MPTETPVIVNQEHLEDIADAIRAKLGVQTTYTPAQMAAAIASITTGGASTPGTLNVVASTAKQDHYLSVSLPDTVTSADQIAFIAIADQEMQDRVYFYTHGMGQKFMDTYNANGSVSNGLPMCGFRTYPLAFIMSDGVTATKVFNDNNTTRYGLINPQDVLDVNTGTHVADWKDFGAHSGNWTFNVRWLEATTINNTPSGNSEGYVEYRMIVGYTV